MRRKFAANLAFLFAANLLVKPYWIFGIDRVVQNKLGAAEYGTYFAVFNYSFLLSVVLDFGINNFNNRAISRNGNRVSEYLLNMLMLKFFLAIVYFSLTFLSAWFTGFNAQQLQLLLLLAFNQILLSGILYLRSNLAAMQLFKTDAIISIADRLLTIVFCLFLLYLPQFAEGFNIYWFVYAQTAALAITAVAALVAILSHTQLAVRWWKPKFARLILLRAFPFALLSLLMGIYYRIDGVMIERMLGARGAVEAGIYAASFRLLDALNMFGYLFATLLLPMFARMIRNSESVSELTRFSGSLLYAFAIVVSINCFVFREWMMQMMYSESDAYWWNIFGWLMLNFVPMSSVYVFGTLLTANGSLKILNGIALGGAVLNVVLNLFLIPYKGALGAAYATLITQLLVAAIHVVYANKTFAIGFSTAGFVRLLLLPVAVSVLAWLSFSLSVPSILAFMGSLLAGGTLAVLLGFVPFTKAVSIIQQRQ